MAARIPSYVPEGLLLFAVVFSPLAFGAVEPWSRISLEIVLFLLLLACVARGARQPDHPINKTLLPASFALIALGVLQYLNPSSGTSPRSMFPTTASVSATGSELILWCSYASLIWCAPQVLNSRESVRRFAWALFILGVVIAIVGIVQRAHGNVAYYGLRPVRHGEPFGPYVNVDHAASLMVMSALTGAGVIVSRWFEFRNQPSSGQWFDVVARQATLLFLLGIIIFAIITTGSRGAVNSLAGALLLISLFSLKFVQTRRNFAGAKVLLFVVAVAYFSFLWINPRWIGYVESSLDASTSARLCMYRDGLRLLGDFPLWGVGLGSFRYVFPAYQGNAISGYVEHVHSDWLEFAVESGIVGGMILVTGLAAYIVSGISSWWRSPSRVLRSAAAGILASIIAFLIHSAVDFSFRIPANAIVFISLLSCLGSVSRGVVLRDPGPGV